MSEACSVLVVEDERILAHSIARFLSRQGFDTDVCYDGHSAVEKAGNTTYTVAIVDWGVPRIRGHALVEQLRNANRECRVVVMSADPAAPESHEAVRTGDIPCLPKPFSLATLLRNVRGES